MPEDMGLDAGATRELFAAVDAVERASVKVSTAQAAAREARATLKEVVEVRDKLLAELREGQTGMFGHEDGAHGEEE